MTPALLLIKDALELVSFLVVIAGVPVAIWQFRAATKKEQQDREQGTYDALDAKFIDFHRLCLEHPDIGIDDSPKAIGDCPKAEGPEAVVRRKAAFTILLSVFERAYLMYHGHSDDVRQKQWSGWDQYLRDYLFNAYFRREVRQLVTYWDRDFQRYLTGILDEHDRIHPASPDRAL